MDDGEADLSHGTGSSDARAAQRLVRALDAPRIPPAARARVFTRLATSIDHRPSRRPVVWGVAGAALGALAVLLSLRMTPTVEVHEAPDEAGLAAVTSVRGAVRITSRAAQVDAALGRSIARGDHVHTGDGGAELAWFGAGVVAVRAQTELVLVAGDDPTMLVAELKAGTIDVATQVAAPARRVVVRSTDHHIEATSARFTVSNTPAGLTVDVASGSVTVTGPRGRAELVAGQRFDARTDAASLVPENPAPTRSASTEELRADARAAGEHAADERAGDEPTADEGAAVPESVRRRAELALRGATERAPQREAREPASASAEAPERVEASKGAAQDRVEASKGAAQDRVDASKGAAQDRVEASKGAPSSRGASEPGTADARATPSMEALYAAATEARDPLEAIGLFDRVAASSDVRAELAAHQAARLTMRIGKCSEATERFSRSLTRWPASAYAEEARLDRLECQLRLGALDSAHAALEDFLRHHPGSARSPEVHFLRGELNRTKGALAVAMPDYRAALGSKRDADARYFLGWCALELGRFDAAESSLRDYLARYPEGRHAAHAREGLAQLAERREEK